MKVAIISSAYHPYTVGGGERSAQQLAENLQRHGIEVFVIAAHRHDQRDEINGVPVYRVKSPNVYWSYETDQMPLYKKVLWHTLESYNPRTAGKVLPILKREKPDVIQVRNYHNFSSAIWKIGRDLGIPVVQTLNDYTSLCYKITMFRHHQVCLRQCKSCKIMTWPRQHLSQYVDQVVAVSQYTLQKHEEYDYFPNAHKSVIYTSPGDDEEVGLPFIKNAFITFGFIGRLHPTKGVLEAIKAFQAANLTHDKLLIAGAGPNDYVENCKEQARGSSNIQFLGKMLSEEFYRQVDVVIIPSLWGEPFPRVIPEAFTYHKPMIVSNRGGSAEVITSGMGYVFDANNFDTLTTIMKTLSGDLSLVKKMHNASQAQASPLFEKGNDVEQYLKVYQNALAKK